MSNVDLVVLTRGRIPGGAKGEIVNTLRDCYRRFGSRAPYKIGILIAETEGIRQDFLREEKSRIGITTVEDEDAVCSYNAWRGYPNISVSVERLKEFSKPARKGALRHEAAHTALHSSLEYNIFKIPDDCRQIATVKGITLITLEQVIRNLSSAIKDCEASKFLISHDFIDCQAAFLLEWIQSPPDKSAFKSTKMDRQTKFIHQTALLKPILLADPLLAMPKSKKISLERQVFLGRKIEELIEHLAEYDQNKLLQIASTITSNLTEDTHSNVDAAIRHVMTLA
jgi:hypothetical protein